MDLQKEFPDQKGFSTTNLKYAKRWYEFYSQADTIRQRPVDEFKWSFRGLSRPLGVAEYELNKVVNEVAANPPDRNRASETD